MQPPTALAQRSCLALAALALWASTAAAAESPSLDQALKQHAPDIIQYLVDHKYQRVGVLKFLVRQGGRTSDNAGPLNLSIANRLEVALVLANSDEKLGIIERASAAVVRSGNRRANHLSPDGRAALFQVKDFNLAWGDSKPVDADAFLTGVVEVGRDGRSLTVTVQAFDRASKDLATVATFPAAADFRVLAETGRSFQLTARGPNESELMAQAVDHAQKVDQKKEKNPLETGKSPVGLKVLYNDAEVPIGGGSVRDPKKGEKVGFILVNRGTERYGVVLKVNGENTLFREPYDALDCYKWILGPGEQVVVRGFQMRDDPAHPDRASGFDVLAPVESEEAVVHYGGHAGTFSVTVFRERSKADKDVLPAGFDGMATAIARGTLAPDGARPGNLKALQARLKKKTEDNRGTEGQRGIIVPGKVVEQPIQYVSFRADPVPVLCATIRYWQPGK